MIVRLYGERIDGNLREKIQGLVKGITYKYLSLYLNMSRDCVL